MIFVSNEISFVSFCKITVQRRVTFPDGEPLTDSQCAICDGALISKSTFDLSIFGSSVEKTWSMVMMML